MTSAGSSGARLDNGFGNAYVSSSDRRDRGKTALLRMTVGLEDVSDGEISIGGEGRQPPPPDRPRHRDGLPVTSSVVVRNRCWSFLNLIRDPERVCLFDPETEQAIR
jgi:hypothetical protein